MGKLRTNCAQPHLLSLFPHTELWEKPFLFYFVMAAAEGGRMQQTMSVLGETIQTDPLQRAGFVLHEANWTTFKQVIPSVSRTTPISLDQAVNVQAAESGSNYQCFTASVGMFESRGPLSAANCGKTHLLFWRSSENTLENIRVLLLCFLSWKGGIHVSTHRPSGQQQRGGLRLRKSTWQKRLGMDCQHPVLRIQGFVRKAPGICFYKM